MKMKNIIIRRIGAFLVDYIVLLMYSGILFFFANKLSIKSIGPLQGQIIGFFTLTLPVFLYFFIMERSIHRGTLGKRIFHIAVRKGIKRNSIFLRNLIKFLPWEIAHTGIYWMVYYSEQGFYPPFWVYVLLYFPMMVVAIFLITILTSKGRHSLYDRVSGTEIEMSYGKFSTGESFGS